MTMIMSFAIELFKTTVVCFFSDLNLWFNLFKNCVIVRLLKAKLTRNSCILLWEGNCNSERKTPWFNEQSSIFLFKNMIQFYYVQMSHFHFLATSCRHWLLKKIVTHIAYILIQRLINNRTQFHVNKWIWQFASFYAIKRMSF